MSSFTVAAVQMISEPGEIEKNLSKALKMADKAARRGAKFVVYPELFSVGFDCPPRKFGELIPGPTTDIFCDKAREHEMYMIPNILENKGNKTFVSSPLIDPHGRIMGVYRKMHKIPGKWTYDLGNDYTVFKTEYCKIGIAICVDMSFVEVPRILAIRGARLVFCPTASVKPFLKEFTSRPTKLRMWIKKERRKAFLQRLLPVLGNLLYIVYADRPTSSVNDLFYLGTSCIVSPSFEILAKSDGRETVITADVDIKKAISNISQLRCRRPETYKDLVEQC
jgi:omega-amidase